MIALVIAVIFIMLNSQEVKIDFLIGETTAPLFFALAISTVLGLVIGWLFGRLGRERHRDRD